MCVILSVSKQLFGLFFIYKYTLAFKVSNRRVNNLALPTCSPHYSGCRVGNLKSVVKSDTPILQKRENIKTIKKVKPPEHDNDPVDGYCMLGDVFALNTYAVLSAGVDAIVVWTERWERVRESSLKAFFLSISSSIDRFDPLLIGALLTTSWLLTGTAFRAFHPEVTRNSVFSALFTTGKIWVSSVIVSLGCLWINGSILQTSSLHEEDIEFVLGSLTVLLMWRSMYAYIFGSRS